ncbi:hypothetical protein ACIQZO_12700 [Streptomyces sp. NPDC097617]|uniref:hypothetical protein n=1 Tax=Streptomyces sp. NPDC097617 TaxID=3366091 RepID=UPI00381C3F9C
MSARTYPPPGKTEPRVCPECQVKSLPIGGPEGGVLVHALGCRLGGRHGIT